MSLIAELKRRNVFRVGVAYAIMGWLLIEVASVLLAVDFAPAIVGLVADTELFAGANSQSKCNNR